MADTPTTTTVLDRRRRLRITAPGATAPTRMPGSFQVRVTRPEGDTTGPVDVELVSGRGRVEHTATGATLKVLDRKRAEVRLADGTVWALGCTCSG